MNPEEALAYTALAWLVVGWILFSRSIRRGRELSDTLAARHPRTYEALGRPRPGYVDSIRSSRFGRYVGRQEFRALADPPLVAAFEHHRRAERQLVIFLLSTLGVIGVLVLAVRRLG